MARDATSDIQEFDTAYAARFFNDPDKPNTRGFYEYLVTLNMINAYDPLSLHDEARDFLNQRGVNNEFQSFLSTNSNPDPRVLEMTDMFLNQPPEEWDWNRIDVDLLDEVGHLSKQAIINLQTVLGEQRRLYPIGDDPIAYDGIAGPVTKMATRLAKDTSGALANKILNDAGTGKRFSLIDRRYLQQAYNALHADKPLEINGMVQKELANKILVRITRDPEAMANITPAALRLLNKTLSQELDALASKNPEIAERLEEARSKLFDTADLEGSAGMPKDVTFTNAYADGLGRVYEGHDQNGQSVTIIRTRNSSREATRSAMNLNPGNLEYGGFAKRYGAIGTDGRFAIFPTLEAGAEAMSALLVSGNYRKLTLSQAIARYAPHFENNTAAYVKIVSSASGVSPNTVIGDLNEQQLAAVTTAMIKHEGWKPPKQILVMREDAPVTQPHAESDIIASDIREKDGTSAAFETAAADAPAPEKIVQAPEPVSPVLQT